MVLRGLLLSLLQHLFAYQLIPVGVMFNTSINRKFVNMKITAFQKLLTWLKVLTGIQVYSIILSVLMGSRVQESFFVEPATFTVSVHEVVQAVNDQHLATGARNSVSRRPRPLAGGDSRALSRPPASQLGSQTQPCRALLPCIIISIVHGTGSTGLAA